MYIEDIHVFGCFHDAILLCEWRHDMKTEVSTTSINHFIYHHHPTHRGSDNRLFLLMPTLV